MCDYLLGRSGDNITGSKFVIDGRNFIMQKVCLITGGAGFLEEKVL